MIVAAVLYCTRERGRCALLTRDSGSCNLLYTRQWQLCPNVQVTVAIVLYSTRESGRCALLYT